MPYGLCTMMYLNSMHYRYSVDMLYYNIMYTFYAATAQLCRTPPSRGSTVICSIVAIFYTNIVRYRMLDYLDRFFVVENFHHSTDILGA